MLFIADGSEAPKVKTIVKSHTFLVKNETIKTKTCNIEWKAVYKIYTQTSINCKVCVIVYS